MIKHGDIEAFSTGGGFASSVTFCDDGRFYYNISNDFPGCLNLYDHSKESDDDYFYEMVWSKCKDELTKDELVIYRELYSALDKHMKLTGESWWDDDEEV